MAKLGTKIEAAAMLTPDPYPLAGVRGSPSGRSRFLVLVLLLAALAVAAATGLVPDLAGMATRMAQFGALEPLIAVAITSLLVSALMPRSVVAAAAGVLYGSFPGIAYVMAGALVGAVFSFEIGRRLGRDFLRGRPATAKVDRVLERRGATAVLILRLLPVAPFGLVSYALGATAIRRLPFVVATGFGIAPSTIVFATLGANAMRPTSPAFVLSTIAAVALAVAGLVGARAVVRSTVRGSTVESDQLDVRSDTKASTPFEGG